MRDLVYYIATSIDGFIADAAGRTDGIPVRPETLTVLFDRYPETCPTHVREALGITSEPKRFDTVIMGSATHQPALDAGLTSAYPHLTQFVATHRELPADATLQVIRGDVAATVSALKREEGADIWLCGGGDLAGQLIDVIDEIQLKVNPVLFGTGIPLFGGLGGTTEFEQTGCEAVPGGVALLTYRRR